VSAWVVWAIVAVALAVGEIFTPGLFFLGPVALAAILSCGALIDGVKQFPGPWAWVPVGACALAAGLVAAVVLDPPRPGAGATAVPSPRDS